MSYIKNLRSLAQPLPSGPKRRRYSSFYGFGDTPQLQVPGPDGCPGGQPAILGVCVPPGAAPPVPETSCPEGQMGMPPMIPCTAVPGQAQPGGTPAPAMNTCPEGQIGWPQYGVPCAAVPGQPQNLPAQPGACPPGTVGMPPFMPCTTIPAPGEKPVQLSCPAGSTGTPPNCVPTQAQPPAPWIPAPTSEVPVALTDKPWFLPAVIGGALLIGAYALNRKQQSRRSEARR